MFSNSALGSEWPLAALGLNDGSADEADVGDCAVFSDCWIGCSPNRLLSCDTSVLSKIKANVAVSSRISLHSDRGKGGGSEDA